MDRSILKLAVVALVKALASGAIAAILLIGVPWVLVAQVGNPFPSETPNLDDVWFALSNGQIEAQVWVDMVSVVAWLAWGQLALSFFLEIIDTVRGVGSRTARGLRSGRWFAGKVLSQWVMAVSLVAQTLSSTAGAATVPALEQVEFYVEQVHEGANSSFADYNTGAADAREADATDLQHVEIGSRDTLWGLAEDYLGDGENWTRVRDLNVGRAMPDGTILPAGFTMIEKGWVLALPQDADMPTYAPDAEIEVEKGDNLWRLSDAHLSTTGHDPSNADIAEYVEDVADANRAEISDPDLIYPGQVLSFPSVGQPPVEPRPLISPERDDYRHDLARQRDQLTESASEQAGRQATAKAAVSAVAHGAVDDMVSPETQTQLDPGADSPGVGYQAGLVSLGVAGGLLASGALNTLRNRRRYRLAHRRPGTVSEDLQTEQDPMELALQTSVDAETRQWLDMALNSLGARPIWEGESVTAPSLVHLNDAQMNLYLAEPDPMAAPMPWMTDDGGLNWHLDRAHGPDETPSSSVAPLMPTLVTVGDGILLNLEAVGVCCIDGEGESPMSLVRSMIHELATSSSAGVIDIRTTLSVDGTQAYSLVREQSPASLVAELVPWLDDVNLRFESDLVANAYALRLTPGIDPLGPLVVLTDLAGATQMVPLMHLAAQRRFPIAILVVGMSAYEGVDACSIVIDEQEVRLDQWGLTAPAQLIDADVARRLGDLLDGAAAPCSTPLKLPIVPANVSSYPPPSIEDGQDSANNSTPGQTAAQPATEQVNGPDSGGAAPASPGIRVRVLGAVEVDGIEDELTSQQLSLICFLACNGPSTRAAITDGLWDGQMISKSRFPNLMAEVRAKVGRHHFPEMRNGRYQVVAARTDVEDFERAVIAANDADSGEAARLLRQAMGMVSGVPFTRPDGRFWSWVGDNSHLSARTEALVADTAARLARLEQFAGNLDGARVACEQGLVASPADETLVALLTDIYMEMGKPGLARRLVDNWEDKISRLECGDPSDEPRRRLAS